LGIAAYAEAGVQHVMVHPLDRDVDDWDAVIEGTGRVAARPHAALPTEVGRDRHRSREIPVEPG
jgi:hypothetical protein